jgi:hypothetical protein
LKYPKKGPPFPSFIYYSSSQKSSLLCKFERVFEAIKGKKYILQRNFENIVLKNLEER